MASEIRPHTDNGDLHRPPGTGRLSTEHIGNQAIGDTVILQQIKVQLPNGGVTFGLPLFGFVDENRQPLTTVPKKGDMVYLSSDIDLDDNLIGTQFRKAGFTEANRSKPLTVEGCSGLNISVANIHIEDPPSSKRMAYRDTPGGKIKYLDVR